MLSTSQLSESLNNSSCIGSEECVNFQPARTAPDERRGSGFVVSDAPDLPADSAARLRLAQDLREAAGLSEREDQALRCHLNGIKPSEFAAALGVSRPAATQALSRAMAKLAAARARMQT